MPGIWHTPDRRCAARRHNRKNRVHARFRKRPALELHLRSRAFRLDMSDWTGSEAQRRRHGDRDACRYPNAPPTPTKPKYVVERGTSCLIKKVGDERWKRFETTKRLVFDSVYRKTEHSPIFFRVGYLLCVRNRQVTH